MQHEDHIDIDPAHYAAEVCDITFNEESFFINVTSGRRGRIYVMTPKHAKRLHLHLKKDIEAYEKKFGELKTSLDKNKSTSTGPRGQSFGFSA